MTWMSENHRFLATLMRSVVGRLQAAAEGTEPPTPNWKGAWPAWKGGSRPAAIRALSDRLSLSTFERDLLVLAVSMELEGATAGLCGTIHGNPELSFPTARLALKVLDGGNWRAISEAGTLRRWGILQVEPGAVRTLARLSCDERVWQHLLGISSIDARIYDLVEPTPALHPLDAGRMAIATEVEGLLRDSGDPPLIVQLTGTTASAQVALVRTAAEAVGRSVLRVPVARVPLETKALRLITRLLNREVLLEPRVLLLDLHPDAPDPLREAVVRALVQGLPASAVIATPKVMHIPGRAVAVLQVPTPTEEDQRAVWRGVFEDQPALALGMPAEDAALELAATFALEPSDITTVARQAQLGGDDPERSDPRTACRVLARSRMGPLAERIGKDATWADLVLPEGQHQLLEEIALHARHRATVFGRWGMAGGEAQGLAVLFSGPSGTGKTLGARAVASHLGLDLWRIDLSRVVDKYIGETEKNLARVFDAAEGGGAVLLFDEADALFGKRSAVKDSHDRYANIQVGYLLQRMEGYRGVAILTTNLKASLDPAFIRRLRFIVDFPMPDAGAREEIWKRVLPASMPMRAIAYDRLAQLNATGAIIGAIATHAAVLAAEDGALQGEVVPLQMHHLRAAAVREFQKHSQPITRRELEGWE